MREIDSEILQNEWLPKALEIQLDDERFMEICRSEHKIANDLVQVLRSMNLPVRITSQSVAPIVVVEYDCTPFDKKSNQYTKRKIVFSKIVPLADESFGPMMWGRGNVAKMEAKVHGNKMHYFLEEYFEDKDCFVEEYNSNLILPAELTLENYPRLNENIFIPHGGIRDDAIFYSDIFDRFTEDEILDDFEDGRRASEFSHTFYDRKERYLTQEEYEAEEREFNND